MSEVVSQAVVTHAAVITYVAEVKAATKAYNAALDEAHAKLARVYPSFHPQK